MSGESRRTFSVLFADRFLSLRDGSVWDLALDRPASIGIAEVAPAQQRAWADGMAALAAVQHPALALCLDYGEECGHAFHAVAPTSGIAHRRSPSLRRDHFLPLFLDRCDLPASVVSRHAAHSSLWVPSDTPQGDGTGRRAQPDDVGRYFPRRVTALGLRLLRRPEWEVLLDLLERPGHAPAWIALRGAAGSGRSTAVRWIAREARVRGWQPLAASVLGRWSDRVPSTQFAGVDRQLLVLDDGGTGDRRAWAPALLHVSGRGMPAPVVVSTSNEKPWGAVQVSVSPFTVDDLCRMAVLSRPVRPEWLVRRAEAARGNPAAYLRGLGLVPVEPATCSRGGNVAREVPAIAGDVARVRPIETARRPLRLVRPDHRVEDLRRRADQADALAVQGRHAAAERQLRESSEALARRGVPREAAAVQQRLAALLLRRGRTTDALSVLQSARERAAGDVRLAGELALLTGWAQLEAARLAEAEANVRAALLAATDPTLSWRLRLVLSRVRLWRGDVDQAEAICGDESPSNLPPAVVTDWLLDRSHIAFVRGELFHAGRHAHAAVSASAVGRDDPFARALATRARMSAAAGDLATAMLDAAESRRVATAAHWPLTAIRAVIVSVAIGEQAGDRLRTQRAVAQLQRCLGRSLPPLLQLEVWRTLARADPTHADAVTWRRRGAALARMAGIPESWWRRSDLARAQEGGPMLDAVLRVLELCHGADDERRTLEGVAGLVRDQTGASTVAFLALDGTVLSPLAWAGTRPRCETAAVAQRAVESGLPLPPHATGYGCEAVVPVRYGAAPVGALACRWLPGSERGRDVMPLLSATAAAAAPCVRVALDRRAPLREGADAVPELVGTSVAIAEVRQAATRAAAAPFPVLIEGESGCGKELVARAIHRLGPRRERHFCEVNAAALTDELLESELFGHARGAFTGAIAERPGLFEEAHGGTLFLDEVGELSPRAQAKLLRALQEGEIRRVGESCSRKVDVRIVAATNRSLPAEVKAGRFRHDLMYRLDVIRLTVPPLRDRVEDIPLLAQHFWGAAAARTGSRATLAPEAMTALALYAWPGNVRELQNVMAALAVSAPPRGRVGVSSLPAALSRGGVPASGQTLEEARRHFEERFVRAVLARAGGRRGRAAAELGLTRQGFAKLLQRLGLESTRNAER